MMYILNVDVLKIILSSWVSLQLRQLAPSLSCANLFLFFKSSSAILRRQTPRLVNDLLILILSAMRSLLAFVFPNFSDPARSTNVTNCDRILTAWQLVLMFRLMNKCDREDWWFNTVVLVARLLLITSTTSTKLAMFLISNLDNPSTSTVCPESATLHCFYSLSKSYTFSF